jgi:hypothetical protein
VILSAVVATTPPGVVAHRRSCLRIIPSAGVYDVAGITVLSLSALVKDPLLDRRLVQVGRLPRCTTRVDICLLALSTVVIPRVAQMAYAGRRAFGLLHVRLLDEDLRLAMQVTHLECRGHGHGSE